MEAVEKDFSNVIAISYLLSLKYVSYREKNYLHIELRIEIIIRLFFFC